MNRGIWNKYYHKMINIFFHRRTRATLSVVLVLWAAVITQVVVNRAFQQDLQITEAFIKSDTVQIQSSVEFVAEYNKEILSPEGKKELIQKLADAIGLSVDSDITVWEESGRSEYSFDKKAKEASTELKVVSLEEKQEQEVRLKDYIVVRLSLSKGIQSIDEYKGILERTLKDIGADNIQLTLKYEGNRSGAMTYEQKREVAENLVHELQGKIALDYDEGDIYTVYAYTGMIDEYVTTMDTKINIQIAITYNESADTTRIMLATPVLNESF